MFRIELSRLVDFLAGTVSGVILSLCLALISGAGPRGGDTVPEVEVRDGVFVQPVEEDWMFEDTKRRQQEEELKKETQDFRREFLIPPPPVSSAADLYSAALFKQ